MMRWILIVLLLLLTGCSDDGDGESGIGSEADSGTSVDAAVGDSNMDEAVSNQSDVAVTADTMGVTEDAIADTTVVEPDVAADVDSVEPGLMDPSLATAEAPATYSVLFETTAGDFTVNVTRDWAPRGADRFFNLVRIGYYDDVAFFRVIDAFMAQTGIHGDPDVNMVWSRATISDDPNTQSNVRGRVSFATGGPNSRTTQIFFNFVNNEFLDNQGFSPFGEVDDMTALDALYNGYGEGAPQGNGPNQGRIQREGNTYLKADFPELDYIERARIQ